MVNAALSKFSCSKNPEIENFVRKNAIDFAKKKMSITYLVYGDNGKIPGIFTLTHKALELRNDVLSNTTRKKVQRHSRLDESTNSFNVSAFFRPLFFCGHFFGRKIVKNTYSTLFDKLKKLSKFHKTNMVKKARITKYTKTVVLKVTNCTKKRECRKKALKFHSCYVIITLW